MGVVISCGMSNGSEHMHGWLWLLLKKHKEVDIALVRLSFPLRTCSFVCISHPSQPALATSGLESDAKIWRPVGPKALALEELKGWNGIGARELMEKNDNERNPDVDELAQNIHAFFRRRARGHDEDDTQEGDFLTLFRQLVRNSGRSSRLFRALLEDDDDEEEGEGGEDDEDGGGEFQLLLQEEGDSSSEEEEEGGDDSSSDEEDEGSDDDVYGPIRRRRQRIRREIMRGSDDDDGEEDDDSNISSSSDSDSAARGRRG